MTMIPSSDNITTQHKEHGKDTYNNMIFYNNLSADLVLCDTTFILPWWSNHVSTIKCNPSFFAGRYLNLLLQISADALKSDILHSTCYRFRC